MADFKHCQNSKLSDFLFWVGGSVDSMSMWTKTVYWNLLWSIIYLKMVNNYFSYKKETLIVIGESSYIL